MTIRTVPEHRLAYTLKGISGARFEAIAKRIFATVFKETFRPLGGMHDGGADGSLSSYIQEVEGKPNTFVQFSVTDESRVRRKIQDTIDALRKAGREPRQIIYGLNASLPMSDVIAQEVFDSHSVMVQVRDFQSLLQYVNSDDGANQAFYDFFSDEIGTLSRAASLPLSAVTRYAGDPTVYVYLNHELRERFARDKLNDRVLDALIYWALRNTDPDKDAFKARDEIARDIEGSFPVARSVLIPNLDNRLAALSRKGAGDLERLRHHKTRNAFCLPYEMRAQLAVEASEMLSLQESYKNSIAARLAAEAETTLDQAQCNAACVLIFETVHRYFVEQGVLLAAVLEQKLETITMSDQVVEDVMAEVLETMSGSATVAPETFGACMKVLRSLFYRASAMERQYMLYLSRTSCLLVTMQSAPKLLEYLNQLGGNFRLLVGSDLLVKAISEYFLDSENRQVTNLLAVCKQLGSELVFPETSLNEVFHNLHSSDLEFRNHYAPREAFLKPSDLLACDRILIRAYLHAKRQKSGPRSWAEFVNQLADPDGVRGKSEQARQSLREVLCKRHGMKFLSTQEMIDKTNNSNVAALAQQMEESVEIKHVEIAYNDALMAHATYALRQEDGESGVYDGFGFRTWWLTKKTRVLGLTGHLVRTHGGVPYVMRPEFILNFVALAPRAADVRRSCALLLPTTAGLQLGHYLSPEVMKGLLHDAEEWAKLSPERVSTMMSEKVNQLTHDRFKRYPHCVT